MREKRVVELGWFEQFVGLLLLYMIIIIGFDLSGIRRALDRAYPPPKESPK